MKRPNYNCIAYDLGNELEDLRNYFKDINKYCDFIETENKRLKLCEVGVTFKEKQDTTFSIWLMANEYKRLGNSYVFKKGDKRFDLEQLRQMYNDYLIQP